MLRLMQCHFAVTGHHSWVPAQYDVGVGMNGSTKFLVTLAVAVMTLLFSGCSAPEQSPPTIEVTETVVVTQPGTVGTPDSKSSTEANVLSTTTPPTVEPSFAPLTPVDADGFLGLTPGNYYFSSPSGNLYCGIFGDGTQLLGGCQSQTVVRNLPECDDPMRLSGPMISLIRGGGVDAGCTSEGVYVDEVANVLEYGQRLTIGTTTCGSFKAGVRCKNSKTGAEFMASRNSFSEVK